MLNLKTARYSVVRLILILLGSAALVSCMTYYQRQQRFQLHFQSGNVEQAASVLENDRRAEKRRTRLLYYMDQGVVQHMLGNYRESNEFFEQAYILGEDYRRNFGDEALALLLNPNITEYRGEPFELLMVHYYKAMNFIQLGNLDAALVECRRLNIALNALSDRYQGQNKYRRDAFVHNLIGMVYDAAGDYNNAFIAYRNAFEIYEEDYSTLFGVEAPMQLKYDLLRAAYRTGFHDQVRFYENRFGIEYEHGNRTGHGDVVLFWHNGLGPVKDELNIVFTIVRGAGGSLQFVNDEYGMSFPVHSSSRSSGDLGDLRVIRVALPKFVERSPVYASARVGAGEIKTGLCLAQDMNAVAFQALEDRKFREMGNALLRLAVRQAAEQGIRKEDETIGAIFGILGAIAEQADTRNWQTLPHSVHYTRLVLPEGETDLSVELLLPGGNTARTVHMRADVRAGGTSFLNFHTVGSRL